MSDGIVSDRFLPTHRRKILQGMKANRFLKRITFDKREADPGNTLSVRVPKLNKNQVIVPGSLAHKVLH